jgi:hypothetical protein
MRLMAALRARHQRQSSLWRAGTPARGGALRVDSDGFSAKTSLPLDAGVEMTRAESRRRPESDFNAGTSSILT